MKSQEIALGSAKFQVTSRDDTDDSVIFEVLKAQDYGRTRPILEAATGSIIDIGAHIGTFVLYARAHNPKVPLYAFEPLEANYALLKQHVRDNHLAAVTTSQVAVAGSPGEVLLTVSTNNHNNALGDPLGGSKQGEQKVQALTLDRIFSKYRIDRCDLLKIDCEGAEYDIFAHTAPETFAKIHAIIMEYHEHQGRSHKELLEMLRAQGFVLRHHEPSPYMRSLGTLFLTR